MKYYLHDSNSFNDEKISELFFKFGYEGLGLFYTLLEKLAQQEKPIKTEVLQKQLKVGKRLLKCWNFMESLGIISSNNGETFNKQLLNYSESYQIKKEKNRKKIEEFRRGAENVTGYTKECNRPKVKVCKVKISKDIKDTKNTPSLEIYNHYQKTIKAGAKEDAVKNIDKLLKEGFEPTDLIGRIDAYKKQLVESGSHDPQFWIQANNFFGEKARYKDFVPIKQVQYKEADPNCKLCKGQGKYQIQATGEVKICECRKVEEGK